MRARRHSRSIAGMALAAGLAMGCETLPEIAQSSRNEASAAGSPLARTLTGEDRRAHDEAFATAMATGERRAWRGSQARGVVRPGDYVVVNLLPDPASRLKAASGDIDLSEPLETEQGLHVLTRNSNVRTGPGVQFRSIDTLASGTGVEVVGRVVGAPWNLIAVDDEVRGYVYRNLMIKAPGSELELAGGPQRKARLCRVFEQDVERGGERDGWSGAVCRDGDGWELAPPAPGERGGPALLTR